MREERRSFQLLLHEDDEFDDFITKVWHDTSKIYHNYRDMQSSSVPLERQLEFMTLKMGK